MLVTCKGKPILIGIWDDHGQYRIPLEKSSRCFMKVYDIHETVFTNQKGQFPTQSQYGNRYIMVMANIDSSGVLVEPINNHSDAKLIRTYDVLMLHLQQAGIQPKKHVLDNKISAAMKQTISKKYKMKY
ncbi:hypothetical protein ACHAW6_000171 [Cyclotella cf. meneghiniana]